MKKGYLLVLLTALVSGISIFLNKFGVNGINPYIFTWSKNILVALFLLCTLILFKEFKDFKELTAKQWGKLVAIGFFGGSVPFLLFFKGLSMAPSATASLLHKSMFIFVAFAAVFFLKEKLNKGFLIAAILLFLGNLLLLGRTGFGFGIPELLIMSAVILWSAETIISKHVLQELSSRIVAFGRMFFGVLFILVFLATTGNMTHLAALTVPQIGWIVFTAVLLFLYVTSWYAGLKLIPASRAVCVLLLGSAVTTILSFIYAGSVTVAGLAGVALILSGVLIIIGYSYLASKIRILLPSKN
ncbi:DMT family transporter [Candidatus Woesearchaeota archaeon]|jgi:drug/metabolite transporter (DMT)-like permease|nr:DMT family transporter [Candidatus Woesearchaeota archaeon]